jgi:hypothetical protein
MDFKSIKYSLHLTINKHATPKDCDVRVIVGVPELTPELDWKRRAAIQFLTENWKLPLMRFACTESIGVETVHFIPKNAGENCSAAWASDSYSPDNDRYHCEYHAERKYWVLYDYQISASTFPGGFVALLEAATEIFECPIKLRTLPAGLELLKSVIDGREHVDAAEALSRLTDYAA